MITDADLDKIRTLEHDQVVRYRLGQHTNGTEPDWSKWHTGRLYVAKRERNLKKSLRKGRGRFWEKGAILTILPANHSLVEFCETGYCGNGLFDCEEFLFEIDLESIN